IGLGLYICRSIVDMHQGKISVRKVGGGVSFVVELPVIAPVRPDVALGKDAETEPYALRQMRLDAAGSR
ncbi:MAG: ATP-binding protein, partial [Sulfuricaulis sp.]|uniref:ATP-binding protein n=1 Tax=Sulfuricaulis sp. TaxID=2003553 RepID=UPI003C3E52C9